MINENFGNVLAGVFISKVRIKENGGNMNIYLDGRFIFSPKFDVC